MTTINETLPIPHITVLLVEDETLQRQLIKKYLDRHPNIEVIADTGDGDEALRLYEELAPHVLVLDPVLKGSAKQGEDVINELRRTYGNDARVLVVSGYREPDVMLPVIRAGALGYVIKHEQEPLEEFLKGIFDVALGERHYTEEVNRLLVSHLQGDGSAAGKLTRREREIADLIRNGMSNKEIAVKLTLSVRTVKVHVSHILNKLGVASRDDIWRAMLGARKPDS